MLRKLVSRLDKQLHERYDGPIFILDNASDPAVTAQDFFGIVGFDDVSVIHIGLQPPNLAYNMNVGFDAAEEWANDDCWSKWNVVMLCDDIDLPDGWVSTVTSNMREAGAAAASTHTIRPTPQPILKTQPDSDIVNRMQGSAFVVAGEKGIRADESMQWWWQDQDLDWQARLNGGMVIAPGPVAVNQRPNDFTYSVPGLGEQAGRDGEAFQTKWGWKPW